MQELLIYALSDPSTGEVRYVGMTKHGFRRVAHHFKEAVVARECVRGNRHKARWLRQILDRGQVPVVSVLERCSSAKELASAERRWIATYRAIGARLTNKTAGGEGVVGLKHRPESRASMSAKHRERFAAGAVHPMTGKTHTPEIRARLSAAHGTAVLDDAGVRYSSINQAAKATGVGRNIVAEIARGERDSYLGRRFSFARA